MSRCKHTQTKKSFKMWAEDGNIYRRWKLCGKCNVPLKHSKVSKKYIGGGRRLWV